MTGVVRDPLFLLQSSPFCNIECDYCYLPDRRDSMRMSPETVELIARSIFEHEAWWGRYTFLWHLGEPLAVPPEFYRHAFSCISRYAQGRTDDVVHSFQTNATLLDERWTEFFLEHRPRIGVSLDGPAFLHDARRRTRRGDGTHAAVMQGIRRLQDAGLPFGVICVLTAASLDHADDLFEFFLDAGVRDLAFNIDEREGIYTASSFQGIDLVACYARFLRRFLDRIHEHRGAIVLRELRTALPLLLHGAPPSNLANQPLRIVSFDCRGNYSTFCPELRGARSDRFADFVMGNIHQEPLSNLQSHPVFRTVATEVDAGLRACEAQCHYWAYCGGGEPSGKFFEHGRFDATETLTCRVHRQATIEAIVEWLRSLATDPNNIWITRYGAEGH